MAVMHGTTLSVRDLVYFTLRASTGPISAAWRSCVFAVHRAHRFWSTRDPPQIGGTTMSLLILVVDDEPDVEVLFRQQFRCDLRAGRFTMEFAQSAQMALQRIADAAGYHSS